MGFCWYLHVLVGRQQRPWGAEDRSRCYRPEVCLVPRPARPDPGRPETQRNGAWSLSSAAGAPGLRASKVCLVIASHPPTPLPASPATALTWGQSAGQGSGLTHQDAGACELGSRVVPVMRGAGRALSMKAVKTSSLAVSGR